ncbi:hypothetical protein NFI96_026043 [Prochilodus magdalenae]|nr:hypothetical protein NFI96_026043 [Prochilodus magdalenae]
MAPHGKELSEDLIERSVDLHKDGRGYKKTANTLKLSCSMVATTIQRFNRTGSTQNRPRHGPPKKLSACAQHHIQRLSFENRRRRAASIAAEVEQEVGLSLRKPLLKTMHKKAHKQFAEDKQTKDMDYWNRVLWSDETKIDCGLWRQPDKEYKDKLTNATRSLAVLCSDSRSLALPFRYGWAVALAPIRKDSVFPAWCRSTIRFLVSSDSSFVFTIVEFGVMIVLTETESGK